MARESGGGARLFAENLLLPLRRCFWRGQIAGGGFGWVREASETAACSVQKALSSLVFIIRELQSYALQLRSGVLVCDDSLREIMFRVHREVHASFCWLFGHIFAFTPTLMFSIMLLLANFTVYSMSHTVAASPVAVSPLLSPSPAMTSTFEAIEESRHTATPSAESLSSGWHGGGGGGSKAGRVAGASDDGSWIEGLSLLNQRQTILHEGTSSLLAVEEREMAVVRRWREVSRRRREEG